MKNITTAKQSTTLSTEQARYPFLALQKEINNAINEFYNFFGAAIPSSTDIEKLIITPRIDIIEDDKNYKIEVEMPGMDETDVKVFIHDHTLTIQGKKEISKKDEGKGYIAREIGYGIYKRDIPLPDYVETEEAQASFKKGMLWISFPKKAVSEKKGSEVKVEKAAA